MNVENLTDSWSGMSKPTTINLNNFNYGLNLEIRILDNILYEVDSNNVPP
jgi:hypothetical protein